MILDVEHDAQGAGVFGQDVGRLHVHGVIAGFVVDQALIGRNLGETDAVGAGHLGGMVAEFLCQRGVQFLQRQNFRHFGCRFFGALGGGVVHGGVDRH
ncbi:hypothetical protein D3C81_2038450 [compost metagenome]